MSSSTSSRNVDHGDFAAPPEIEVVIEIPRGSFLKRGSTGHIDFVSPLPCPFNYGSVPSDLGLKETCWTQSCSDPDCGSVRG